MEQERAAGHSSVDSSGLHAFSRPPSRPQTDKLLPGRQSKRTNFLLVHTHLCQRQINTVYIVQLKFQNFSWSACHAIIIIIVLPPVAFQSNRALPMRGTGDGDAISRCKVLSRAGSVHQTSRCCMVCLMPQSQISGSFEYNHGCVNNHIM